MKKIIKVLKTKKLRIYPSQPDKCLFVCEDFISKRKNQISFSPS